MFFIAAADILFCLCLGMVAIGMFVSNLMFQRMSWEVNPPKSIRESFSILWITSAKSKSVLHRHTLMHPESKIRLIYRTAGVAAITGLVGVILSIFTTCFLILH